MHFIITGHDGTDDKALERRMNVREEHMRGVADMVKQNKLLYAAAMLNDNGKMIGSTMIVDFESREAIDEFSWSKPVKSGFRPQFIPTHRGRNDRSAVFMVVYESFKIVC